MSGKRERHRRHANPFSVREPISVPNWRETFGRDAPLALDIGFGEGRFLLALAQQNPQWNVLGLEIRRHFVDQVIEEASERGLSNVHACLANACIHLQDLCPPQSVVLVSINFPDPWYKRRHHKRRIIQAAWLDVLATKMRPGGELHFASDYKPSANAARKALDAHPSFAAVQGGQPNATTGAQSEREMWHVEQEDPIYRLRYRCERK